MDARRNTGVHPFATLVGHGERTTTVTRRSLRPGRGYHYRFRVDGHLSPVGRTRTTPEPWVPGQDLTMCFASCAHFGEGYFTAYRRLAEDHPDVVLHLGDTSTSTRPRRRGYVRTAGAGATTLKSFVVVDRDPGPHSV